MNVIARPGARARIRAISESFGRDMASLRQARRVNRTLWRMLARRLASMNAAGVEIDMICLDHWHCRVGLTNPHQVEAWSGSGDHAAEVGSSSPWE